VIFSVFSLKIPYYDLFILWKIVLDFFAEIAHPDGRAKPDWEMRKVLMIKVMKACLTTKWDTKIHVVYMFYSENNPNITRNFSKTMLYDADDVENFCRN